VRKFFRIGLKSLAIIAGFLILLIVFINLPFSKKFITRQVNGLFTKLELPLHIHFIRTVRLKSVHVEGFSIIDPQGDTIIYAGKVKASIHLLALTRSKVKLEDAQIARVEVKLLMNEETGKLTIAEAFKKDKKKKPPDPDKKKKYWEISIHKVDLSKVLYQMTDSLAGVHVLQDLNELEVKKFNLSLEDREITAHSLELTQLDGNILLEPALRNKVKEASQEIKAKKPWNYGVRSLALNEVDFSFHQSRDSLLLKLQLDEGSIGTRELDFPRKIIDVETISLDGLRAELYTTQGASETENVKKSGNKPFPWDLKSQKLKFEQVSLCTGPYDPQTLDSATSGKEIENLELNLHDFQLSNSSANLDLRKLSFNLDNGFALEKLEAELDSDSLSTQLSLTLESGNSHLNLESSAKEGFLSLLEDPAKTPEANMDLHNTQISFRDIALLKPELKVIPSYPLLADTPISLELSVQKDKNKLIISELKLSQIRKFMITLNGFADNSFDPAKAFGKLDLEISELNMPWVKELLDSTGFESAIPDSTELTLMATLSDTLKSPHIFLGINSNLGKALMAGFLDFKSKSYRINSGFKQFQLGKILAISELETFSGSLAIEGSGFSMESMESDFSLKIDSLHYHDYDYTLIGLAGHMSPGKYDLNFLADDPHIKGSLEAELLKVDSTFSAKASGSLLAQLDQLHFIKDTLSIESRISMDFEHSREAIKADLHMEEITLITPWEQSELAQFTTSFSTDSIRTIFITESDFMALELQLGKTIDELGSIGKDYQSYLQTFINPEPDSFNRVEVLPEINATGHISYHDAMSLFIDDPEFHFSTIDMSLNHLSLENKISYHLAGSGFENRSLSSENLELTLSDSAGFLDLALFADSTSVFSGPRNTIILQSEFNQQNSINSLTIYDSLNILTYELEIAAEVDSNLMVFKAPSQQFILNRQAWIIDSSQFLWMDTDTKRISPELKMYTSDSSMLHLSSRTENELQTFFLDLKQMDIASLLPSGLVPGEPAGLLSGSLAYGHKDSTTRNLNTDLSLKDARFSDLNYEELLVRGFFAFSDSGDYEVSLSASLDSAAINMKTRNSRFEPRNVQASFSKLPLNTMEPFAKKHVSKLSGTVSGDFNISTPNQKEHYNGELAFDQAMVRINTLNASYRIPNQRIQLENDRVVFNDFTVLDSLNKSLLVDGYLDLNNPEQITSNLNISSSNLQVMNREASKDASFYGSIFVDSRIDIKGPINNPTIDGRILLTSGTEVYYQHKEDLSISESSRILNFVDYTEEGTKIEVSPIVRQSAFNNSSIETIVEIDPSTEINFNVTQRIYGIELKIKGGGMLNYSMLNQNQISLSGNYNIEEGAAELKLVGWPNKSFEIMDGGFVRWDGRVENPELNFTAINRVTSAYQNPLDGKMRNADFNVILKLSEHLSNLDIQLTFDTPDQYLMSIINTLSPEDQMRQAITILLFETVDLPGISTTSDYMTQQVNQIVAAQLNQLTKSTIKGVDISFGLDTYQQAGSSGAEETTTSLSYEVSKSLLNNRAQIEVSGRLSNPNEQPGSSDMSYNNISFEYRLDSAATKYLKVYNEHSYEDVFEGEVIRTGVGITYRKRYKRIKDIWRRDKKRKEKGE